jgi:hypothetical protein
MEEVGTTDEVEDWVLVDSEADEAGGADEPGCSARSAEKSGPTEGPGAPVTVPLGLDNGSEDEDEAGWRMMERPSEGTEKMWDPERVEAGETEAKNGLLADKPTGTWKTTISEEGWGRADRPQGNEVIWRLADKKEVRKVSMCMPCMETGDQAWSKEEVASSLITSASNLGMGSFLTKYFLTGCRLIE